MMIEGLEGKGEEMGDVTTEYWVVSDAHGREIGTTQARTAGTAVRQVASESKGNRSKAMLGGGAFARRLTDNEVRARGLGGG